MPKEISLKGCFPPIPTPFDNRGRVGHDHLTLNLERWQRTSLAGFVVLGSNGEAILLRERERLEVWRTARSAIGRDRLFIAGTGCESTAETVKLTERAAGLGADAAMVVTPHYYKPRMDHRALIHHYTHIADHAPIPIILYNVPAFTGIDLTTKTIVELAQHPNVMGIKESSGDLVKIGQVAAGTDDRFQVLAGSGGFFLPALVMGAGGGVMALACVAAGIVCEIMERFERGEMREARQLQGRLIPVNTAITTEFGIPGLKAALDLIGLYGGPVRSPLIPLDARERERVGKILKKAAIGEGQESLGW